VGFCGAIEGLRKLWGVGQTAGLFLTPEVVDRLAVRMALRARMDGASIALAGTLCRCHFS
jgi:hypothetical protein